MAQELLAACLSLGLPLEATETVTLMSGCVGETAAHEFLTYARELDLPDPEDVLRNPKALRLPERGDRAYAVLVGVVAAVLANNTEKRWNRAWDVLAVAVNDGKPDIAAGAARSLAFNRPKGNLLPPTSIDAFLPLLKEAGLMTQTS
jgi:hypothetical protein